MSIQNSLNGVTASIAGAAIAGKKAHDAKEAKREGAQEDLDFSSAELAAAKANSEELGNKLGDAKNALAEAEGNNLIAQSQKPHRGLTRDALNQKQQQALDDLTAAQRAFDELTTKHKAAQAMESRWKARVLNARKQLDRFGGRR